MKPISLLLMAAVLLAGCAGTAGAPAQSVSATTYEPAKSSAVSPSAAPFISASAPIPTPLPSPSAARNLIPVSGGATLLVPYSPADFSPSLSIGPRIIEHDGFVYYVDNDAIYKMNESTGHIDLVRKKKEPIRELFFDTEGNLYYTADNFTPADESGSYSTDLYKYGKGKDSVIIKDIGSVCLVTGGYIYYIGYCGEKWALCRRNIATGKTEEFLRLPGGEELDISAGIHISGEYLYYGGYTSFDSPILKQFVLNMRTNEAWHIYKSNGYKFSVDSADESLDYFPDGAETGLSVFHYDTQAHADYRVPMDIKGFIYGYIISGKYMCVMDCDSKTQRSILWKINPENRSVAFRYEFDGMLNDSAFAGGKWYLHFKSFDESYEEMGETIVSYDIAGNTVQTIKEYGKLPEDECVSSIEVIGGYLWEFGWAAKNYDNYSVLLAKTAIGK